MANSCWLSRARGWRGTPGTPRCSVTLIHCKRWRVWTSTYDIHRVRTTTTTTTPPPPSPHPPTPSHCTMMADPRPPAGGVAQRRRERLWRLRSTTVLDRRRRRWSFAERRPAGDRRPAPEPGRVRCTRRTTLHGDRTLPGERRGSPFDLGPQRSDRSLRRSAGVSLATLALSSLARSAGEAVNSSSLRFLTAAALRRRR